MRDDMIADLDFLLEKARKVEHHEDVGPTKALDAAYTAYDTAYDDFLNKWCKNSE
jgi:hypothetical protein